MFSNIGKKCFKLWCVLCAVQFVTHNTHHSLKHFYQVMCPVCGQQPANRTHNLQLHTIPTT